MKLKKGELLIAKNVDVAKTVPARLVGLMFGRTMGKRDALLLDPCNSIHTFFMRYNLDIVFLNGKDEVVKIIRNMKPWRMSFIYLKARKVLEMTGGTLPTEVNVGDKLIFDV